MEERFKTFFDTMATMFMEDAPVEDSKHYLIKFAYTPDYSLAYGAKEVATSPRLYTTLEQANRDTDNYNNYIDDNFMVDPWERLFAYVVPVGM